MTSINDVSPSLSSNTNPNSNSNGMPFNVPYGMNFFDIFLQHVMKNGWESITFATFMSLWMYVANDKIKTFIQYLTQKIEDKVKTYGGKGYEYCEKYFWIGWGFIQIYLILFASDMFAKFKQKMVKYIYGKDIKIIKKPIKNEEDKPIPQSEQKQNQIIINIDHENKIDLLAFSYYIMSKRNELEFIDEYNRKSTMIYTTKEMYPLPKRIIWTDHRYTDITFNFNTSINFQIVYETDQKNESLRDIIYENAIDESKIILDSDRFYNLLKSKKMFHDDDMESSITSLLGDDLESFKYSRLAGSDTWRWSAEKFI